LREGKAPARCFASQGSKSRRDSFAAVKSDVLGEGRAIPHHASRTKIVRRTIFFFLVHLYIHLYPPLSTSIHLYPPLSTSIHLYPPLSTSQRSKSKTEKTKMILKFFFCYLGFFFVDFGVCR
jgi:hypothetical protein